MILSSSLRCSPSLFRETRHGGPLPEDRTGGRTLFDKREPAGGMPEEKPASKGIL